MKPSNTPSPRVSVTCQVVRFWSAVRHENAPSAHHLETCESCRQFVVSTQQLHLGLRQEALGLASTPPSEMERRIIEAIRFSPPSRPETQHRSFLTFAVAGSAAALVFVGLWHFNLAPFPGHSSATTGEYTADVAALVAAVRSLPGDVGRRLEAPATELANENSLGREVENVYSDARSALDFLALNFLPASSAGRASAVRAPAESPQRT